MSTRFDRADTDSLGDLIESLVAPVDDVTELGFTDLYMPAMLNFSLERMYGRRSTRRNVVAMVLREGPEELPPLALADQVFEREPPPRPRRRPNVLERTMRRKNVKAGRRARLRNLKR